METGHCNGRQSMEDALAPYYPVVPFLNELAVSAVLDDVEGWVMEECARPFHQFITMAVSLRHLTLGISDPPHDFEYHIRNSLYDSSEMPSGIADVLSPIALSSTFHNNLSFPYLSRTH